MAKWWSRTAAVAGVAIVGIIGAGASAEAAQVHPAYATIGARTSVPYGWVDFCNRYGSECDGTKLAPLDVDLSAKAFSELDHINNAVNKAVEPVSDMDHWNVVDRWDYPLDGKGDCEDYALLKRKLLMEAGFPRQALLMTVVKDQAGDGHAVLTVKTNKGEFVLDNLTDRIKLWSETGYKFVKRQSQDDPDLWQTIVPPAADQLMSSR